MSAHALGERPAARGRGSGLYRSFIDQIDQYVLPVIYPAGLTHEAQFLIGAGVLALNSVLYGRWLLRNGRRGIAGS